MMKNRAFTSFVVFLFYSLACGAQQPSGSNGITVSVMAPIAPVLKGVAHNPLLRIRVYVPAGNGNVQLKGLQCTLNKGAVNDMEKLELFATGSEPDFNAENKIAGHTLLQTQLDMPLELALKPGLNYIWISAALKQSAGMDGSIGLSVRSLTDASGKRHTVTGDNAVAEKRIGIAVRKAWDDSVHTYRIPGITTTNKGTLIAVYDIRYKHSGDLPANIDVGMSRSTDGGRTWQPMKIIMDMGAPHENNGVGDPAVLFDPVTKKIWVAALWSKGNRSIAGSQPGLSPDTTGQFVLVSSDDDGLTWSQPYNITPQVKDPKWHLYFNGPGNGIAMQNGTLVFPSQYWDESKKPGIPHSALIYSSDGGKSWKSGTGAKSNTTESQLVETTPGTVMLNMRDNRGSYRSIATTTNLGQTWTEHHTSYQALPDPVCMASIIKANVNTGRQQKDVLFFSNVASQTGRVNMTVKWSADLGESWPDDGLLIDERRLFGYSALTKIDDNTIGLLYEGVRDLYFVRIPVQEIMGKK